MSKKSNKRCFVIAPIGEPGSETRKKSDQVLRHIIIPAAQNCGYDTDNIIRADKINDPGIITTQVIERIIEDDLVIADLSMHNPNVYYELAIRHATGKPIVLLIRDEDALPFDISQNRTIKYNLQDPDSVSESEKYLEEQIEAVEKDPAKADNPLKQAINLKRLMDSTDPESKANVDLLSAIQELRSEVLMIRKEMTKTGGRNTISYYNYKFDPEYFCERNASGHDRKELVIVDADKLKRFMHSMKEIDKSTEGD